MICRHVCLVKQAGVNYHIMCEIKKLMVYIKVLKPTIIMFMLSYISNSVNLTPSPLHHLMHFTMPQKKRFIKSPTRYTS